ncbi:MAG: cyclic nucleotide-binding domain-containing protein [Schwartzia sp.]|nr:cyclic nucleotide-binding domain-containing protein [Schwartzia sp. (in: firmicutes)]
MPAFQGDRIEGTDRDFLFVAEGKLARSIEDGEGWYCTLDIVKDGAWINETVMLEERKATLSVEVLSERAEILVVSKEAMENILTQHPSLYKKIITYAVSQLEKYQRLWAQS